MAELDRRTFLKSAAIGGSVLLTNGCSESASKKYKKKPKDMA